MRKFHHTTDSDNLASQHKFLTEWTPEKFLHEAFDIHEDVAHYIGKVLEKKAYPEQTHKSCFGILSFARRAGPHRLAEACRWVDSLELRNSLVIKEMLRKRLGQLQHEEEGAQIPQHNNIRGKDYYQ